MMSEVETKLQRWGCPKVNLAVRSTNERVIAFYRGLGYEVDSVSSLGKRFVDDKVK